MNKKLVLEVGKDGAFGTLRIKALKKIESNVKKIRNLNGNDSDMSENEIERNYKSVQAEKVMRNNLSTVRMLKNGNGADTAALTDKTLNFGCALFMNGSTVSLTYVKVVSVHEDWKNAYIVFSYKRLT